MVCKLVYFLQRFPVGVWLASCLCCKSTLLINSKTEVEWF
jgi:hypothetical protein